MAEVRVLQEIQVSPTPPVPSQASHLLSFLDSIFLYGERVERLFFYDFPHPTSHFIDHHLHSFVTSLSLSLRYFYPLAGTIRRSPSSEGRFEIVYTEGDSVSVTIAEFPGDDFRDISGNHPRSINKMRLLVPKRPESLIDGQPPPLSVQVTLFPNQGLCIGLAVNHAACDGSGMMQFIRSWAAAFRSVEGTLDIVVPLLHRSGIVDDDGLHLKMLERAAKFQEFAAERAKEEKVKSLYPCMAIGNFTLRKHQIAQLKKQVQAKAAEEGTPLLHISSFVVTGAYVLRCLVKARGYEDDDKIFFAFAVDWRPRMRPPLSGNYFGNCLGAGAMEALKAGRVAGDDGVEAAAMAIGKGIVGLQGREIGDVLIEAIDRYLERAKTTYAPLSVAGSPKLGVYKTDFGWGRPTKVEVTSIVESGAMSLAESREEEGGLEIGLVLPEEEMKEFKKNFENDLLPAA